jgi:hypothetical protein
MHQRSLLIALAVVIASCSESNPADPSQNGPGAVIQPPAAPVGPASVNAIYDRMPNIAGCDEGVLKPIEKQKVLTYLNALRRVHGLMPVEYRAEDDIKTAKAALIITANNMLTHHPTSTMSCYTAQGDTGSQKSNLAYRTGITPASEVFIEQFVIDKGVANLGHRRWVLDPFLKYVSFGRVDRPDGGMFTGAALRVSFDQEQDLAGTSTRFVAYPYHDYPARLMPQGTQISLSLLENRSNKFANKFDFSGATISVVSDSGATLPVTGQYSDSIGYGLPNVLSWKPGTIATGVRHTVTVSNVKVDGVVKEYSWWFRLVN